MSYRSCYFSLKKCFINIDRISVFNIKENFFDQKLQDRLIDFRFEIRLSKIPQFCLAYIYACWMEIS